MVSEHTTNIDAARLLIGAGADVNAINKVDTFHAVQLYHAAYFDRFPESSFHVLTPPSRSTGGLHCTMRLRSAMFWPLVTLSSAAQTLTSQIRYSIR